MCNFCNVSTSTSGCGNGSYCGNYGCVGTLFNGGSQRFCRDCCGNIRVRQCCNSCNSCNACQNECNCGCNENTQNQNGGFTCLTICGNATSTGNASNATTVADAYYARQYGLSNWGGCACGSSYNYDTITQTT